MTGAKSPGLGPVTARRGLVATSQPLASEAGLSILREGGNAVDAAITAAATLAVVEPTMAGIGGDLFAILWMAKDRSIRAINSSGRAPEVARLDPTRGIPDTGLYSVTVPGTVDGWDQLLKAHGTIPLARALAPAIEHAQNGFEVTPVVARQWQECEPLLSQNLAAATTFLPGGRAPRTGEVFVNPRLARALEQLAEEGAESFYHGALAESIVSALAPLGEWIGSADLAAHSSDWVTPIQTSFRGLDVLELPPNTQGATALEILNLIEPDVTGHRIHNGTEYCHLLAESIQVAMLDRDAHLADPATIHPDVVNELISKPYASTRRRLFDRKHATNITVPGRESPDGGGLLTGANHHGDTVCLAVVDGDGNAVSLIQSLFGAFGSGVVAGDTGVILQNRGSFFSSDPTHPNCLAPGKRPLHTLIPAIVLNERRPWLVYGVMGGDMQAQGHAQVLTNMVAFGMNVQAAGSAPRIRWMRQGIALEDGVSSEARQGLLDRGHRIINDNPGFGGFQGIHIETDTGLLRGGSDPRKDGLVLGY